MEFNPSVFAPGSGLPSYSTVVFVEGRYFSGAGEVQPEDVDPTLPLIELTREQYENLTKVPELPPLPETD